MQTDEFQEISKEIIRVCGSIAIDMNLLPLAFTLLAKILSWDPFDIKSILLLSYAYFKNKSYISVIHLLIDAVNFEKTVIAEDVRIWKQLAISYYKLNRYEDAHHAILQSIKLLELEQNSLITHLDKLETKRKIKYNNYNTSANDEIMAIDLELKKIKRQIQQDKKLEHNIFVLYCRITLLAQIKNVPFEQLLIPFQQALNKLNHDKSYFVEVLLTRAQLFRKFQFTNKCREDLFTVIKILNDNSEEFDNDELLVKVLYSYHFLASLEFTLGMSNNNSENNLQVSLNLIKEAYSNFVLPVVYSQPLLILETEINYLSGSAHNIRKYVEKLKYHIPLSNRTNQPMIYYTLGRLHHLLSSQHGFNSDENLKKAYDYYQQALSLTQENPIIWVSIAALYFELDQLDDALSTYYQAINLSTSNDLIQGLSHSEAKFYRKFAAIAWFGISQVYTMTNQIDNAIDSINEAIKLFKLDNDIFYANKLDVFHRTLLLNQVKSKKNKSTSKVHDIFLNSKQEDFQPTQSDLDAANTQNEDKLDFVVPNVPIEILIDFQTYRDEKVFKVEYELERIHLKDDEDEADDESTSSINNKSNTTIRNDNTALEVEGTIDLKSIMTSNTSNLSTAKNSSPSIPSLKLSNSISVTDVSKQSTATSLDSIPYFNNYGNNNNYDTNNIFTKNNNKAIMNYSNIDTSNNLLTIDSNIHSSSVNNNNDANNNCNFSNHS